MFELRGFAQSLKVRHLCALCTSQIVATSLLTRRGTEGQKGNYQLESSGKKRSLFRSFVVWPDDYLLLSFSTVPSFVSFGNGGTCRLVNVCLGYGLNLWHGFILLAWALVLTVQLHWIPGQKGVTQFTECRLWLHKSKQLPLLWTLAPVFLECISFAFTMACRGFPWCWHKALWDLQATLHLQCAGWTLREVGSSQLCCSLLAASILAGKSRGQNKRFGATVGHYLCSWLLS